MAVRLHLKIGLVPAGGALASRPAALPGGADPRVAVWRGEIAVGDSLLLVSRNVTRSVGVEEFKNALVTLHPQSAVEHLHHLFAAAAAEGSDALLALEVAEAPVTRAATRLPARPPPPPRRRGRGGPRPPRRASPP